MNIKRTRTVEERIEDETFNLDGVIISDAGHTLDVYNDNGSICHRPLVLNFDKGEYKITLDQNGMQIERLVKIPPEVQGADYYEALHRITKGKCYWENSSSCEPLKIPFGAREVVYKK